MLKIPHVWQFSESQRLARKSDADFEAAVAATNDAERDRKLEDAQEAAAQSALAAAYTYLQRAVGVIALALPFVLVGLNRVFFEHDVKGSISEYYYTPVGGVFVGSLCAVAVFFLSYNYRPLPDFKLDNVLSTLASVAALGVAFFPTTDDVATATTSEKAVGVVHLVCAAILFAMLAYFSLVQFRKSNAESIRPRKQLRNRVYLTCGVIILIAILGVPVANGLSWHVLLPLEWVAVFAFSISWLVKGGAIPFLNDPVAATPNPNPAIGVVPSY